VTVFLELPLAIICKERTVLRSPQKHMKDRIARKRRKSWHTQRTDLAGFQPTADAVEMEGVVANTYISYHPGENKSKE